MGDLNIQRGTLSPPTLQRLGERLRGEYLLPATLPSGVYDLLMRLEQRDGPNAPDEPASPHHPRKTITAGRPPRRCAWLNTHLPPPLRHAW
jgi:hypothetical protein